MTKKLEVTRLAVNSSAIKVTFAVEGSDQTMELIFPIKDGLGYYPQIAKALNQLNKVLVEEAQKVMD